MSEERLAKIFNEWKKRYEKDPDSFNGLEGADYGTSCAAYLLKLDGELSK